MKRFLLAVLAVALLAGGALANPPVINIRAKYKNDDSLVDLSKIKPYEEMELLCKVTSDSPILTFNFDLIVNEANRAGLYSAVPDYEFQIWQGEFASEETGYIEIYARDENGEEISLKQNITALYGTVPVTGIDLSLYPYTTQGKKLTLDLGVYHGSEKIMAIITPYKATNKNIKWVSSNEGIVTVKPDIGEVKVISAVAPGKATITATTEDGGFEATCDVTVTGNGENTPSDNNESPESNKTPDSGNSPSSNPGSDKSSNNQTSGSGGGGGGCNTGWMGLFALALLWVRRGGLRP